MKAGSYISLARNYSFVILLLAFIAVQGTQTYTHDMWQVENARRLFTNVLIDSKTWEEPEKAKNTVEEVLKTTKETAQNISNPGEKHWPNEMNFDGVATLHYELTDLRAGGLLDIDIFGGRKRIYVRFFYHGSPAWASPSCRVYVDQVGPQYVEALAQLHLLYRQIFGKEAEIPSGAGAVLEADTIRKKIESPALERRTAVPGVGLEFRSGIAPWFIALTVLGLVVQIRNQIRRTFLDPELALSEPWLILDGRRGLEKIVAAGWAFGLLVAPWITTGCLISVSAADGIANGWVEGIPRETFFHLCVASLLLFGGWSSLTMVAELVRLRRLRLEMLATLGPTVSTSQRG